MSVRNILRDIARACEKAKREIDRYEPPKKKKGYRKRIKKEVKDE